MVGALWSAHCGRRTVVGALWVVSLFFVRLFFVCCRYRCFWRVVIGVNGFGALLSVSLFLVQGCRCRCFWSTVGVDVFGALL